MLAKARKLTLYGQLTIIASVIILIPLVLISLFLRQSTVDAYGQISARAGDMSIREARNTVEASLAHSLTVADKIVSDSRILDIMKKAQGEYPALERIDDIRTLRTLLSIYEGEGSVSGVRLVFTHEQQWLSNNSFISIPLRDFQAMLTERNVRLNAQGMLSEPTWIGHDRVMAEGGLFYQEGISYVRIIRDMQNFDRILGYVVVYQQYAPYERILSQADITGESVLAMTDESGTLVAIGGGEPQRDEIWQMYAQGNGARAIQVITASLSPKGWSLTMLLPQRAYNRSVTLLTLRTVGLSLLLALVGMFFARGMYQLILRRIHAIVTSMERVQEGDLSIRLPVVRQDELGRIESHFNHMLDRVGLLIEQTMRMEKQDRLMRIRLLRSQINPHFLYNTLNSILWVALGYNATKVCQMIKALSDFYKISLQPGSDEATIGHEVLHVQRYVALQNLRGEIDVTMRIQVDDTLREHLVPNMLLQPLVENCFVHGFVGREKGVIALSVEASAERRILIAVTDDGVGMTREQLATVLESSKPEHTYGLYSIAERLRLRYGDEAVFDISLPEEGGCRVIIQLPVREL